MKTKIINFDIDRFNKRNYISLQTKCGYPVTIYNINGKDDEYYNKYVIHGCYTRDNSNYVNRWSLEGESEECWSADNSANDLKMEVIDHYEENDIVTFTNDVDKYIALIDLIAVTKNHIQSVHYKTAVCGNQIYKNGRLFADDACKMATPQEIKTFNHITEVATLKVGDTVNVNVKEGFCCGKVCDVSLLGFIKVCYWNGSEVIVSTFNAYNVVKIDADEFKAPQFKKGDIVEVDATKYCVKFVKLTEDFNYTKGISVENKNGFKWEIKDINAIKAATSKGKAVFYGLPISTSYLSEENAQINADFIILKKLVQLRDAYRQGWVPSVDGSTKYSITNNSCYTRCTEYGLEKVEYNFISRLLSFQTAEIRDLFFENFHDLIDKVKYYI